MSSAPASRDFAHLGHPEPFSIADEEKVTDDLTHVSDTALMVAGCRAIETSRADGLIRDPFAERLAGERGIRLARSSPFFELMSMVVGTRCRILDELTESLARSGNIRTVVSLGAGLDSRPWRLDLPPELRWIEVDYAAILGFKHQRLSSDAPHCRLQAFQADLNSAEDRARLFAEVGSRPALMITEGLLMYLQPETVKALAREAPSQSGIHRWLLDAERKWQPITASVPDAATAQLDPETRGWLEAVARLRPADYFGGNEILHAIEQEGWKVAVRRLHGEEFKKMPASRLIEIEKLFEQFAGKKALEEARDETSGVYLLEFPEAAGC